ncbi:MAG: YdcF family protein [Clostridia bacterium]|nr:YdcF family protein [Clostridia bacterium]
MKKKIKRMLVFFLILIICAFVLLFGINAYVKLSVKNRIVTSEGAKSFDADAVLVLGCLVKGTTPSGMLSDRLDTALTIEHTAPFIMSGDHGTKEYDEVNAMRDYAVNKGVAIERVFMDHAGFCTYDSIYRAKEVFGAERLVIVTQEYHLSRALYIAKRLGIDAIGVPSDLHSYYGQTMREVREVLARNKDFFSCLLKVKPKYLGDKIDLKGDGRVTEG